MAVSNMMDPHEWLSQHLAEADPGLVRSMLQAFVEQLIRLTVYVTCDGHPTASTGHPTQDLFAYSGCVRYAAPTSAVRQPRGETFGLAIDAPRHAPRRTGS